MLKSTSLLVGFVLLLSCSKKPSLDQFQWMVGEWESTASDSITQSREIWTLENENSLIGIGLTIEGTDTLFYERLKIGIEGSEIYYLANVGDGFVKFPLTVNENERWVFSNPDHDFPKNIIYQKSDSLMIAFAEAEEVSIRFEFNRIK